MSGLKIWLLQTWEPNPLDDPTARPWRTGMLAQRLVAKGHDVTWWCSSFSHTAKQFRKQGLTELGPNYRLRTLPALGYKRHVSLARLRDHRHVAWQWRGLSRDESKPDLIVASYPTIELCAEAARYAKEHAVPLLIDIRDQYPDLYWENAPRITQSLVRILCQSARQEAVRALGGAVGITANGPEVVDWGLGYAGRKRGAYDQALYMSYDPPPVTDEDRARAQEFWKDFEGKQIVAYTGMIGQTIEVAPIMHAVSAFPDVEFVFAGGGDGLAQAQKWSEGLPNVHFTGWLKTPEIQRLLELATLGLVPYRDRANFERGITNKPVEYLAYSLPIITSLQRGPLVEMLLESGAGRTYRNTEPATLAKVISEALSNSEQLKAMRSNARELFERTFHPDKVFGDWIEIIEAVAAK